MFHLFYEFIFSAYASFFKALKKRPLHSSILWLWFNYKSRSELLYRNRVYGGPHLGRNLGTQKQCFQSCLNFKSLSVKDRKKQMSWLFVCSPFGSRSMHSLVFRIPEGVLLLADDLWCVSKGMTLYKVPQ